MFHQNKYLVYVAKTYLTKFDLGEGSLVLKHLRYISNFITSTCFSNVKFIATTYVCIIIKFDKGNVYNFFSFIVYSFNWMSIKSYLYIIIIFVI